MFFENAANPVKHSNTIFLNERSDILSKKNKLFADDGWAFWVDGDEVTVNHYRTKLIEVLDKVDTLVF